MGNPNTQSDQTYDLQAGTEVVYDHPLITTLTDDEVLIKASSMFMLYEDNKQFNNKYGLELLLSNLKAYIDGTDDKSIIAIQQARFAGVDKDSIARVYAKLSELAETGLTSEVSQFRIQYFCQQRVSDTISS